MKQIRINEWGECTDEGCPFRKECGCHSSAGDFRSESGFTPEIFIDTETQLIYCKTISEDRFSSDENSYLFDFPKNIDKLGRGFINILKVANENTHN